MTGSGSTTGSRWPSAAAAAARRTRSPFAAMCVVELFGPDGELKASRDVHNLVVDAGKAHIADRLSTTPAGRRWAGWRSAPARPPPPPPTPRSGTEIDRNATTSITDAANVVTYVGNWAAGDGTNSAIAEAGIFNASVGRDDAGAGDVHGDQQGRLDTLAITWTVTVG